MHFKLSARLQADMMEDLSKMLDDNIPIKNAVAELAHTFVGRASDAARRMQSMLKRATTLTSSSTSTSC